MHKCLEQAPEAATEPPTAHLFMLQLRLEVFLAYSLIRSGCAQIIISYSYKF